MCSSKTRWISQVIHFLSSAAAWMCLLDSPLISFVSGFCPAHKLIFDHAIHFLHSEITDVEKTQLPMAISQRKDNQLKFIVCIVSSWILLYYTDIIGSLKSLCHIGLKLKKMTAKGVLCCSLQVRWTKCPLHQEMWRKSLPPLNFYLLPSPRFSLNPFHWHYNWA